LARLPELQPLAHEMKRHRLILDGEIISPGDGRARRNRPA
jgi:hypothetical protein